MAQAGLLVLDNALDHDYYRPVDHWTAAAGFEPEAIHVAAGQPLPSVDAYPHVILTGSEASITQRAGWAEEEARWLAEAIRAGTAVLGSCWGHQLIALALAGPGAVRRSDSPEFGWLEVQVADTGGLLPAAGFATFVSHFDEVAPDCHPDCRCLASTPGCQVQAMRWADKPVWGIQAHPEVDPDTGRGFLKGASNKWPEHKALFEAGLAGPVVDTGAGVDLVSRFLATGRR